MLIILTHVAALESEQSGVLKICDQMVGSEKVSDYVFHYYI